METRQQATAKLELANWGSVRVRGAVLPCQVSFCRTSSQLLVAKPPYLITGSLPSSIFTFASASTQKPTLSSHPQQHSTMAFRKRNIGLSRASRPSDALNLTDGHGQAAEVPAILRGTRPSPLTGQPTTSTGAYSLDSLLGGHAGLAMGSSLFIEENGTTDFAGALLRYYAAEGLVQGHMLHVVGVGEQWVRELPGLVGAARETEEKGDREGGGGGGGGGGGKVDNEKMKIAWRYERLGQFGADRERVERAGRGASRAPGVYSQSLQYHRFSNPVLMRHSSQQSYRTALPPAQAQPMEEPRQSKWKTKHSATRSTSQNASPGPQTPP